MRLERIEHKKGEIIDSINFVSDNFPYSFEEFKESKILMNAPYKQIEFAIQNVIDICSIINSDLNLGFPESEDLILEHLKQNKIFNKAIIKRISEMKGFRNILIHRYGEINDEQAYEDIKQGLEDFEKIIKEIEDFLDKHKESGRS